MFTSNPGLASKITTLTNFHQPFQSPEQFGDLGWGSVLTFFNMVLYMKTSSSWLHWNSTDDIAHEMDTVTCTHVDDTLRIARGRLKNTYELLNLRVRALKYLPVNKIHIFQCMGEIFCVEFQRYPLKFHTKYLTHTSKYMFFIQH